MSLKKNLSMKLILSPFLLVFLKVLFFAIFFLILNGCFFSEEFRLERKLGADLEKQDYVGAVQTLEKIVKRNPKKKSALEASRQGARLAQLELKDFELSRWFLNQILTYSDDSAERMAAQAKLSSILFYLGNYRESILEYSRILDLPAPQKLKVEARLNIARSYFRLDSTEQAFDEVTQLLKLKLEPDQAFEAKLFLANILSSQKKTSEAQSQLESLLKEFPERSRKEKVGMNLAVNYEETLQLDKAIEVLSRYSDHFSDPDYVDIKIKRLKDRKKDLPGARGLRK